QSSPTEEELLPQVSFNGEQVKFNVMGPGLNSRSIDLGADDDLGLAVNVQVKRRNEFIEES
ncbi:MAG: hypothetical protein IJZ37_04065, partial [Clostridia bacterium]|nr:hypothetical protein [Clostridia bacterium]